MAKIAITPSLAVGSGEKLLVISGPCQIESREHCLRSASELRKISADLPINLIFKSSFDKANRTSIMGARGVGIENGLAILAEVKAETGLPVLTDVHTAEQATLAAEVVDVLQTPAFLCRQTDFLTAVGATGRAVNIKKGQFLPPEDMRYSAEKVSSTGNQRLMLCERGTTHGYRDLIVDMRGFEVMRSFGYPLIFDATHSVQSMGGKGGASGGDRRFVVPLIRAALAVGVDGLFIECHNAPDSAPSDGATMLPLASMRQILSMAAELHQASQLARHSTANLELW